MLCCNKFNVVWSGLGLLAVLIVTTGLCWQNAIKKLRVYFLDLLMKLFANSADKLAIGLSAACAVHCLLLPLFIIVIPQLAGMAFASEEFHEWMIFFVLPISIFALTMGCRQHQRYRLLVPGVGGLVILVLAVLTEQYLGEWGEKSLTLLGSALIAFGHFQNYKLCQQVDDCHCDQEQSS